MARRQDARRNKKPYSDLEIPKTKGLGRGISLRVLNKALEGASVARSSRKKITRAVNSVLMGKKKDSVQWRVLFADVPSRKGKKKKQKK